jgi:enterochelin esterase-like enzyme
MRRRIAIIGLFLILACRVFPQEGLLVMEDLSMKSRILNQEVKFSVCLPDGYYGSKGSYPVVYLLHGLGDDAASWLEYGRISQFAGAEEAAGAIVPMIFIMPEGYRTYYVNDYKGTFLYQDMFIKELVPYIDSTFRTLADRHHRALMGYSMGGFGALTLCLEYPQIFGCAVPLSISIRTDEQYMTEYAPEWDQQWGRLFGGEGLTGEARITDYYKANNPFYIIPRMSPSVMKNYRIYIDNGDKEETLCRSNEELHILMRNQGFPHEFRVRNGGHSFAYWCSALPNALHFISDAFEGKPYRGDIISGNNENTEVPASQFVELTVNNEKVTAFLPAEYTKTDRYYPALYVAGDLDPSQRNSIAAVVNQQTAENQIGPMVVIFLPASAVSQINAIVPGMEEKLRLRRDYHMRSLAGYRDAAGPVLKAVTSQPLFSSCVIIDGYLQKEDVIAVLTGMKPDALKKTPLFIYAPDKGRYYEENGNLHMILRDKDINHEYRVTEGDSMEEIIKFISLNFHR